MANFPSLWSNNSGMEERRDSFQSMARLRREMDDLFQNFLSATRDMGTPFFSESAFQPLCEVEEKESHFLVSFDVPGMSRNDIKIEVIENQLHVTGERRQEREEKKGKGFESERYYGSFERWLTLPQNAKAEEIEARVENGILQLAIPKAEKLKSREIKIGEGRTGVFSRLLSHKDSKEKDGQEKVA